jgi:hypothetical protein
MPGFLLNVTSVVTCAHGGQARPAAPNPRVLVMGSPSVTLASPYMIAGCALPPPIAANGPCVTAKHLTSATRVFSMGQPLLLMDSQAICAPSGTPLLVAATQTRVAAI